VLPAGAAAVLLLGAALILAVVANSRFWVLPGSVALYPERAPYFMNALCPLALAVAWRALPLWSRRLQGWWALGAVALVAVVVPKHLVRYHRTVTQVAVPAAERSVASFPVVGRDEYAVLRWCGGNLNPATDLVDAGYNTAGSYLPAVAGVAVTGWHIHCFILTDFDRFRLTRPPTHRLLWSDEPGPGELHRVGRVAVTRLP
jgi:hypothetical protein